MLEQFLVHSFSRPVSTVRLPGFLLSCLYRYNNLWSESALHLETLHRMLNRWIRCCLSWTMCSCCLFGGTIYSSPVSTTFLWQTLFVGRWLGWTVGAQILRHHRPGFTFCVPSVVRFRLLKHKNGFPAKYRKFILYILLQAITMQNTCKLLYAPFTFRKTTTPSFFNSSLLLILTYHHHNLSQTWNNCFELPKHNHKNINHALVATSCGHCH